MKPGPDSFALIKNDLQKVVTYNFLANGAMSVDFTLSLVASYILKYPQAEVKCCPQLDSLAKTINRVCFPRKKVTIGQLSYSDCVRYIDSRMEALGLQDKIQMLLSLKLKPILEIDSAGHISFRDNLSATPITRIKGEPADKYTVKNINIAEEMPETSETVEPVEMVETAESAEAETDSLSPDREQEPSADSAVDIAKTEVSGIPQTDGDGSSIDKLFTDLLYKLTGKRSQNEYKYVWQWMLTKGEYETIKNTIKNNPIPTPSKWTDAITKILELYIGEFYKREYDGGNNPFSILDGSHNTGFGEYDSICDKLRIIPYRNKNQVYQFTLYVSGGLPIYQITNKLDSGDKTTFIDGLSYLLGSTNDTIDITVGEDRIASVTNTALQKSYQQRESIYLYIQNLIKGEKTWAESDNSDDTFSLFKAKVTEANDKAKLRKKFRICYSMWTYLDADGKSIIEMSLTPEVRFNPEDDGARHYAISEYRVNRWGIRNRPASFNLEIAGKKIPFSWCYKGDYISNGLIDRVSLAAIDKQSLASDSLPAGHKSIRYTSPDHPDGQYLDDNQFTDGYRDGILQLYTDDDPLMASWVSFKGNRAFYWSALLFDRSRYRPVPEENFLKINDGSLGWIWFSDFCTLEDMQKQKPLTIFNSKGNFYARPADGSIHPLSENGAILPGSLKCTIDENSSPTYIVKDKNIKFNLFKVSDDTAINVPADIVYRRLSGSEPAEWRTYDDDSEALSQGFYEFKITFAGYSTALSCFVLGDNANITLYSQGEQNYIKFPGISGITSQNSSGSIKIQSGTDCPIFRPEKQQDNYKFSISDGNNYLEFSTYPPKVQTHIFLNGKEIKEVIAAYADKCRVSIFSGKRSDCYTLGDRDKVYQSISYKMTATVSGEDAPLTGKIDMHKIDNDIDSDSLFLRLYTKDIEEYKDNGSLYFLDFKSNDVTEITGNTPVSQAQSLAEMKHSDGLLFQSLKDNYSADFYCAPKYISREKRNPPRDQKIKSRQTKLSEYAKGEAFAKEIAFRQFEVAITHKLYLAFSDPLLSMMWNVGRKDFIKNKECDLFKTNLLKFLSEYVKYKQKNSSDPDINGLIRLSKEFMFNWKSIAGLIKEDKSGLSEIYSKLTTE